MADILSEYQHRHGLPKTIAPVTEGLLFLRHPQKPEKKYTIAALVSSVSKSYQLCRECRQYVGATVLELVQPCYYPRLLIPTHHSHFVNEFDLVKEIQAGTGINYVPISIPTARELEQFVWEMFMEMCSGDQSDLGSSFRMYMRVRKPRPWADEAVTVASEYHGSFQAFYDSLYSPLLINRKYLLLGQ